jgi:hypothetical protein
LAILGCGGSGKDPTEPLPKLDDHMYSINTNLDSEEDFPKVFTADSGITIADKPEYNKYEYTATSWEMVDENTANAKVEVYNADTRELVGEQEWVAVKEGEDWKFKSAPLPSGS